MLYARQPTDEEHQELQRMVRQEVGRVSRRAQIVLASVRRNSVPDIAAVFGVSRNTVRLWLHRFNAYGPVGLYDEERSGRPRKITQEVKDTLHKMMQTSPQQAGYPVTCWTVATLLMALAARAKVHLSLSAVRGALHQLGLRWGRPRLSMPDKVDPDKAQKQWAMVKAVVDAPPEAVVLYADESRVQLLPLIRAMWHWVGQQVRIPTPGTNVSRALFGALEIRTGQWTYLVRDRMRKEDFVAFLEHLLVVYPHVPIILFVDNYSSHTAHLVRDWLENQQRLQMYYLPKYCSHLNPVEGIWLRLKGKVAADRLYGSIQALLEAVDVFFRGMSPATALAWAGA
jgi:transposase